MSLVWAFGLDPSAKVQTLGAVGAALGCAIGRRFSKSPFLPWFAQSKRVARRVTRHAAQPGHYRCRRVQWVAGDGPETAVQWQGPSIDAGGHKPLGLLLTVTRN